MGYIHDLNLILEKKSSTSYFSVGQLNLQLKKKKYLIISYTIIYVRQLGQRHIFFSPESTTWANGGGLLLLATKFLIRNKILKNPSPFGIDCPNQSF